MARIEVIQADITKIGVQAIVNAANKSLLGGGGVDGAIHRKAGPELKEECAKLGGCETGEAKLTQAYNLHSDYVIHTVGPVWNGGSHKEPELLANCYRYSLLVAKGAGIQTVAFPAISTGVYGYPMALASRVALRSVLAWLVAHELPERVVLCCFAEGDGAAVRIAAREFGLEL